MSEQLITIEHTVAQGGNTVIAEIGNELVALDANSGVCYGLNTVASHVWALIAAPRKVSEICETLRREYNVDAATCEQQVLELLEDLRREGLLVVKDDAVSHAQAGCG